MSNRRITIGRHGEDIAAKYLRRQGFKVIKQNYRCRLGEIDIIARDGEELVFIEVKTRTSHSCGHPAQAVDRRKQGQLVKAAQTFMTETKQHDSPARFDVVAIQLEEDMAAEIDHIRNAFDL